MSLADQFMRDLDSGPESESDEGNAVMEVEDDFQFKEVPSVSILFSKIHPLLKQIAFHNQNSKSSFNDRLQKSKDASDDPEYKLLVDANNHIVEIDNEILVLHRYIKLNYRPCFPELDTLLRNPSDYTKAVKIIGNDIQNVAKLTQLKSFLSGSTFMVISMSAAQTTGRILNDKELQTVMSACDILLSIIDAKNEIITFVSSRLVTFAPNLTAIIGPHTAAQLMGITGGLAALSSTPSCNIAALGSKKDVGGRQQGYLYQSDLIQTVPRDLRTQALRIVAGKIVLASRIDYSNSSRNGEMGQKYHKDIMIKLDKLAEPPENKGPKALPIPDEAKSKKRGGKRIRKMKEQFKQTELQKAANRMVFGKPESTIDSYDEEIGLGMIDGVGSGKVRIINDNKKITPKLSKGMQQRLSGLASIAPGASKGITDGLVSTLSVSKGIQLINPELQSRKIGHDNEDKWFKSGTFTSIAPKKIAGQIELKGSENTNKDENLKINLKRKSEFAIPNSKRSK